MLAQATRAGRAAPDSGLERRIRDCDHAKEAAGVTLEALCEIAAERERWDEAAELVAEARREAEHGELLVLPPVADRLEGRSAARS